MPEKIITVQVKVEADSLVRIKDKEKMLKAFSNLPVAHQQRMTTIMTNPVALDKLAENWGFLEQFINSQT